MRKIAALSLLFLVSACDKGSDATPAQPEAAGPSEPVAAEEEPGSADVPWEEKDHQQRMEHMGLVVYPAMKEVFQGNDGERFAEFKCQTCHGDDAKEVNYHMPNAVVPLSKDDPIAAGNDMDPEMTKFMMETVVPTMTENMAGEQINCFSCHLEG